MTDSNHSFLWSKFETQTRQVINNLISDTDFQDVTLVSDEGKHIKAHKVILSSSSQFFRQVLSQNPHQHPLLYLKGISSSSLGSILKFIYLGEVIIVLDKLDDFIQASEDLKIIGMLDVIQEEQKTDVEYKPIAKRPRIQEPDIETLNDKHEQLVCDEEIAIVPL